MNLYIWTDEASYTAFAHAASVAQARELLIPEIGGFDGSCPEREKARNTVESKTPGIYRGATCGFRLSDSAEVRELEEWTEKQSNELTTLRAENARLREELAAAKEQLEFDRTTCHNFIKALDVELDGRFWLTEGRGSYAWDDDRYRDEFRDAATALRAVLDPMRKMAQNLASRLPTTEAVMKARVDLNARAETAEKELAYWKTQHDIELTTADELACRLGRLSNAAQAVLDRWDSPKWKDQDPTAKVINELRAALTETPEQSAKLVQAEALREAANLIRQTTPDARSNSNVERGKFEGRMYAIEQLESEADRLEKEAANEHDNK